MLNTLMAYLAVTVTDVMEREDGQGLVEYALILAFVSVLAIAALTALSGGINGVFTTISGAL
jgi:pilus assembly protein Flp/PilA